MAERARPLVSAGVILCVSLLVAAERQAGAAELSVRLEYEAGPSCPEAAEFRAVVVGRLGYDPFVETAPDHVLVHITPRGSAIDGRIEWRDSGGTWAGDQTFPAVSTDCVRVARSVAFALAVQIQLLAKTREAPAEVGATAEPPRLPPAAAAPIADKPASAPIAASEPPTASPVAAASTSSRPGLAIGAGPAIGFGMSSRPVLLGRIFGALAWPRVSLELAAEVSLPATTRRADGAGVSQQHLFVAAAACAALSRWNACLLARAGDVRMAGEDIDRAASADVAVLETGARLGFVQPLGPRTFLNVHADGLGRLIRWTARLDQVAVWTAPRFAASLGVDAGVRFP